MTMTKNHIVDLLMDRIGFTKKKSTELVEQTIEIIKQTLESGDDVLISNFGKFQVNEKSERKGRNPATGGLMMLAPRRTVTFKASNTLRKKMNQNASK